MATRRESKMSITFEEKNEMREEANRLLKQIQNRQKDLMTECDYIVMLVIEQSLRLMKEVIDALPDKGTFDGY